MCQSIHGSIHAINLLTCIRYVYSQCHVDYLKCTEQDAVFIFCLVYILTQVSQLYVHVFLRLKVMIKYALWWPQSRNFYGSHGNGIAATLHNNQP